MDKTLAERSIPVKCFRPQVVAAVAVNGDDMIRPWKHGRKLRLHCIAGAMAANDALTISLHGRIAATGTYETLKAVDGTTALTFTTAKTSDTKELDNGFLVGTVVLGRVNSKYDAIRMTVVNGVAQNVTVGIAATIEDLYEEGVQDTVDDLVSKQLPA